MEAMLMTLPARAFVRHVDHRQLGATRRGVEGVDGGAARFFVAIDHDHRSPLRREQLGNGLADAGAGAGYQGSFPIQSKRRRHDIPPFSL
jgi:hypothetical protein